jgi:hypothetical protein
MAVAALYALTRVTYDKVIISDKTIFQESRLGDASVTRANTEISAVRRKEGVWLDNRLSWSWTVRDPESSVLIPTEVHFTGNEVFLHGFGIVRGDKLGSRIADWAGVAPDYRLYER